ncbi:Rieske (2Fe-2S) protein [Ralstonia soli]|uniref:Rieske 2Fe-2S domain-containing protein n=1 Tax=Ralstonia soli TaxID=2953896 RepID=A0ABT1AT55_9RALS|nr:Rieske 2Fe-2S domain-containing protein [Ralstonia soli]MCO5401608.1 Rieske 2Fe-2S domain-containing protein [Ralstonia soli]
MPRQIPVARADEIAPGHRKLAFIDGRSIVLFNIGGTLHAIDNTCPHQGASLANGALDGTILGCPAHGLRFDLVTGCTAGAGSLRLKTLPVCIIDDKLVVTLDDIAK